MHAAAPGGQATQWAVPQIGSRQDHGPARQYAADQLAWQAQRDGHSQPLPEVPAWIGALQRLDPRVVYFAHDRSVWTA